MSTMPVDGSPRAPKKPSDFAWKGVQALTRVYALNERCLELFTEIARAERQQSTLATLYQHRSHWRGLNAVARRRAARTPFLLVDVNFQDTDWWRAVRDPRPNRRRKLLLSAALKGKVADELMRETLMLAWSVVAIDRGAASLLLGMTPMVSSIIAELSPQDVERIAGRYSQSLQPRWDHVPGFWAKLLVAARDSDESALHEVHLHGVQLIGSELLPLLNSKFI